MTDLQKLRDRIKSAFDASMNASMKSWPELTGSGNPEAHDYSAGLKDDQNIEYKVTVSGNCGVFHSSVAEWQQCPTCTKGSLNTGYKVADERMKAAFIAPIKGAGFKESSNTSAMLLNQNPSMSMVDRVAQAIKEVEFGNNWETMARAAIAAMREPTKEMKNAWTGPERWDQDALEIWHAMIDAALKE